MNAVQREIALLGEITNELKHIDDKLVAMCDTEQAAMRLCRKEARVHYTDEILADKLNTTKGTLNTILNSDMNKRTRHMSRAMQVRFQQVLGNTAVDQWAELYGRGLLNFQRTTDDRRAELLAELAALEGC